MIEFHRETWDAFYREGKALFERHWMETALDQDRIKLDVDEDAYRRIEATGSLHLVTARENGKLAGYYVAFLMTHPHYAKAGTMAFTDAYYLTPEMRKGRNGIRLFQEAAQSLKRRGVVRIYITCKIDHDYTKIFTRLGWKKTDYTFTKYLGG